MTLILALGPTRPAQVPHSCGVGVIYEFVKGTTILGVDLKLNLHGNVFGTRDELDVLQDNRLKNNHLIRVPFLSLYTVDLH